MALYGSFDNDKNDDPKTQEKKGDSEAIIEVENEALLSKYKVADFSVTEKPSTGSGSFILESTPLPWYSALTFHWFVPLLARGNSSPQLNPSDLNLFPLPSSCETWNVVNQFEGFWKKELLKAKSTPTLFKVDSPHKNYQPSLTWALAQAFGRDFIKAGCFKLIHDLCIFVGPYVLHGLIQFLRDAKAPISRGLFLTAAVVASQILMSLCLRHYFFRCYLAGLRIRSCVIISVYQKALRLASSERQTRTSGEIVNLISIDAQRMQNLTTYLHAVWYSFVQIGLAIYFLWQQMGPSCLGGVAVMIVMAPVTKAVAEWMGGLQKRLMKARDERVEVNNEVLGSMKVIKLQAWEDSFQDRILALRKQELSQLYNYVVVNSMSITIWSAVPLFVALATFTAYTLSGNQLDVANALTALALFEVLRFPLFMLPQIISIIVEASISFARVRSFLLCKEYEPVNKGSIMDVGIDIKDATFAYDSKKPRMKRNHSVGEAAEEVSKELHDTRWEIALFRSQLADAEFEIRNLTKRNTKLLAGEDTAGKHKIEHKIGLSTHDDEYDYSQTDLLCLRRINFACKRGELIAVVGGVGCGKSAFLNSILGEVRMLSGTMFVKGRLAYFPQSSFIMNDTLKNNIVFSRKGEPLDEDQYRRAISTCALQDDVELLRDGDMTEIGEKGVTLSGGQKARVAMARAVYHGADIYLLDDPLAAVDAHVGRYIFQNCIIDELLLGKGSKAGHDGITKKSTCILITNSIQYLTNPLVDRIIVLDNGKIAEQGTYSDLSKEKNSLFSNVLAVMAENGTKEEAEKIIAHESVASDSRTPWSASGNVIDAPEVSRNVSPTKRHSHTKKLSFQRRAERKSDTSFDADFDAVEDTPTPIGLMTTELREVGQVNMKVYLSWARAAGGLWVALAIIFAFCAVESINVMSKWYLTYWSQHSGEAENQVRFLLVYAAINISAVAASFGRVVLVMLSGLRASETLFTKMLDIAMRAPMSFFDTTPIGRIVNRFSLDMYMVDEQLVITIRSYLATMSTLVGVVVVISTITPVFILCLIPILAFYISQQAYFTKTYRELKRLDSVSRSPIYALLGESLDGIATIRAYSAESSLIERMVAMLNEQQNAYFLTSVAQCWLAIRLELAGTCIILFSCLLAVLEHPTKGGNESFVGLAGLSISFALSVTQSLNWSVRMSSDLEANMVAVERIQQYCNIISEAPRDLSYDSFVNPKWPERGAIEFSAAQLRYRPGLPLALTGLNIEIPARSKIGVVGRTGAGKSTLMMALLRIVELESGSIYIDGVDISRVGLKLLRSKIAVIPQDPVLFSGTVRTNLDPFYEFGDERLSKALERVGLKVSTNRVSSATSLSSFSEGKGIASQRSRGVKSLEDEVFEGGTNFSVGQRQLIVIARALLCGAQIVIMDEATASVDADTDARIQRVMSTEFQNSTCITVAHRLNTIMNSDFILVMSDGRAAEFDRPNKLLSSGGMFKDLVDASDLGNATQ